MTDTGRIPARCGPGTGPVCCRARGYAGRVPSEREEGLTWEGDDDPTLDASAPAAPTAPAATPLPEGFTAVGRESEDFVAAQADAATDQPPADAADAVASDTAVVAAPAPLGNAALVGLGILGGVYALYAVGWIIGGLRLQGRAQYLVTDVMFQGSLWLAVLAPLLWFGTVFLLTRATRSWVRFAWLGAGAVLLLPWPFVMIGAIGQ